MSKRFEGGTVRIPPVHLPHALAARFQAVLRALRVREPARGWTAAELVRTLLDEGVARLERARAEAPRGR